MQVRSGNPSEANPASLAPLILLRGTGRGHHDWLATAKNPKALADVVLHTNGSSMSALQPRDQCSMRVRPTSAQPAVSNASCLHRAGLHRQAPAQLLGSDLVAPSLVDNMPMLD